MADVIPLDPEAAVCRRSKPASRLARLIGFAHPQCHILAQECREAAYPPEYAERAKKIADDMLAFEEGTPKRASYFMNRVLAGVTVDD
jgi:hypothetical protein